MSNIIAKIKKDLPNFPDEIIDIWLKPFAEELGWPPKPNTDWEYKLLSHNINYWNNIVWNKVSMNYEKLDLTKRFDNCIDEMCNKYKINENFCLNSKERIDHILNYILINKKIPKPIILVKNNNKNEIADGNHRIAAYRLYKEKNDEKLEKQEVWIGELQNTNYQYGAFFWPQNS